MATSDLLIRIVSAAELSVDSRNDILALCQRAYGEDLRGEIDRFDAPVHVLGLVDERIVCHALWITRWLAPGTATPLRTAYVEAVATDPSYQKRGHASTVMGALITAVGDFDLAALCASDDGQALYARLGWETWRGPLYIRRADELMATPEEEVMFHRLPGTPPLDTAAPLSAEWRDGDVW